MPNKQIANWNKTIRRLLERAAYQLDDEQTVVEICARTELSHDEVTHVLEGSREATIEGLYRIANMLNVPPADLINPSNNVFQCYSIDGGRPRTLSLTQDDGKLINSLSDGDYLYVDCLDDSYAPIAAGASVIFVNKIETPVVNSLYLCEKGHSRYVRRCVFIDITKKQAVLSDEATPTKNVSTISIGEIGEVGFDVEMILGRVIASIRLH